MPASIILEAINEDIHRTVPPDPRPSLKASLVCIARVQEVPATYRTGQNPADRQDKRVCR